MRIFLIILQLAATGSDAYFTRRDAGHAYFHELDPIVRPFAKSNAGTIAFFGTEAGLAIYLPHLLRKHGHNKLANELAIAGIANSSVGATISGTDPSFTKR